MKVDKIPHVLTTLSSPVRELYYRGDLGLLDKKMVSIVGSRRPNQYTKEMVLKLSRAFKDIGYVVVSGAAMGVDAMAHKGAFPKTIAVVANGVDIRYPKSNESLIKSLESEALVLSEYKEKTTTTKWSFVKRNRIVVALGEVLIVAEADLKSGSLRSVEIAKELGKEIFVLPQRANESLGTNRLLKEGEAEAIYDIDEFVGRFGTVESSNEELEFFKNSPSLDEALEVFGDRIYELELEGVVKIKNLKVYLV
jgi:DNA processing protein